MAASWRQPSHWEPAAFRWVPACWSVRNGPRPQNYKAALLRAKDSDTIVTGRIGGTPVRVLKNRMSRE